MNTRPLTSKAKGFSLIILVLIVAALGALAVSTILLSTKVADMTSENETIKRMTAVRDQAEAFFRGNESLPPADSGYQTDLAGTGAQDTAVPVGVDQLNMKVIFRQDAWEQGLVYYIAPTSTKGNGLSGVLVNGTEEAGFVLSFGSNQKFESTLDAVSDPQVLTLGGDDIVVPINVRDEALEITIEELEVLTRKQCAYRKASPYPGASGYPDGYWHLFDGSVPPHGSPAVNDWNDFLNMYALQDKYQYDPWGRSYIWDSGITNPYTDPGRFSSNGPDATVTTEDIFGPVMNDVICPSASSTTNLIQNGHFEQGDITATQNHKPVQPGDSTTITGWTVVSGGGAGAVDYVGTAYPGAPGSVGSTRSVNLGDSGSGIYQEFNSVPGQSYLVTFYMSGLRQNPPASLKIKTMDVVPSDALGNIQTENFAYYAVVPSSGTPTQDQMNWSKYALTFTARQTTTRLTFLSTTSCSGTTCGPGLDDVVVTTTTRNIIPVSNSSFEQSATEDIGNFVSSPPNPAPTGWTVGLNGIDIIGAYWTSAHGNRSLDMNKLDLGSIYRNIATTSGTTYLVTFYLAGNPMCGSTTKQLRVTANTSTPTTNTYNFNTSSTTTSAMGWSTQTFEFTATAATTTLTFEALQPAGTACGPALDYVLVEVKP